jgi:SET domain-containing protein
MKTASTRLLSRTAQQMISHASPYKLRVFRSGIHRLGVRAGERIPAGRKIIEYAGERISRMETRRRFLYGSSGRGCGLNYLAQLDPYWTIDGAVDGTGAELINHSCEPNLRLRKFRGRLWLFSVRRIRAGEELGYDYGFSENGKRVRCRCGSATCRGTINRK